jgi:uncharacterized membrane protein YsdA (DUF1294 family)
MWDLRITLIVNAIVFIVYAIDKLMSVKRWRRVPETVLILGALCWGALGALLAMELCRHKTKKLLFRIGVPLLLGLQVAAEIWYRFF